MEEDEILLAPDAILEIRFIVANLEKCDRKYSLIENTIEIYGEGMKCIGWGKPELENNKLYISAAIRKDCYEALALSCECDEIYPQVFYRFTDFDFYLGLDYMARVITVDSVYLSNTKSLNSDIPYINPKVTT